MKAQDLDAVLDTLLAVDALLEDATEAIVQYHDVQLEYRCQRVTKRIHDAITSVTGFRGSERALRTLVLQEKLDRDDAALPAVASATLDATVPLM